MYTIRASSLGTFNVNPYKYKYGKFTGDPLVLGLGDIIHYFTRDDQGGRLLLDFYTRNLKKDLKQDHVMKKLFDGLTKFKQENLKDTKAQYDEMPMMLKVFDDMIVTGTADKIVEYNGDDTIHIFDWKTTNSLDWYADKYRDVEQYPESRIREENLQRLFYGLGAMEYLGYEKAKFSFVALEKKATGKIRLFSKEFTKEEGRTKLYKVCEALKECYELDMRPHKRSRYCLFGGGCSDICPNNPANKEKF